MSVDRIKAAIRDIRDFPKPGIVFKDITPVIGDAETFRAVTDLLIAHIADRNITRIAAIDARGFIFAGAICERLGLGLVPIRKRGKLPYDSFEQSYDLEYGSAALCIHRDAFQSGERVALVDDLLATGGTAAASVNLVEQAGAEVVSVLFLIELAFLEGRAKLDGYDVFAPIVY